MLNVGQRLVLAKDGDEELQVNKQQKQAQRPLKSKKRGVMGRSLEEDPACHSTSSSDSEHSENSKIVEGLRKNSLGETDTTTEWVRAQTPPLPSLKPGSTIGTPPHQQTTNRNLEVLSPPPAPKKAYPNKNRRRELKSQGVARMLDFEHIDMDRRDSS